MQEAKQNNRQEVTLQTISHASEALMFRSEALRTRYINAQRGNLARAAANQRQPMGRAKCLTQSQLFTSKKPYARPVDRRASLMDSLIAQIEMAARTNGMSLAKSETVGGYQA